MRGCTDSTSNRFSCQLIKIRREPFSSSFIKPKLLPLVKLSKHFKLFDFFLFKHCTIVKCEPEKRSALLHNVFEILMDCNSKKRNEVGRFCVDMLRKGILTENNIITS